MTEPHALESPAAVYDRSMLGQLDRRFLRGRNAHVIVVAVCVVIFALASIKFVKNIHTLEDTPFRGSKRKTAVGRWLPDPIALWEGENPYGVGHWFPCSPLVLVTLTPLAYLGVGTAAALWLVAKAVALILTTWFMLSSIRARSDVVPLGLVLMALLFSTRPLVGDIQHGNLNIFVLCEIAAAWYLFVRGRDGWAGIVLGLAIVTKVTPALLLVYFLYKRCWRLVGGCGLGLVLFFFVVPGIFVGFGRNIELLTAWIEMMVLPYALEGWVTVQPINQSLPGMFMKWFAAPDLLPLKWPNISLGATGEMLQAWFPVRVTGLIETRATGSPFLDIFFNQWAWYDAVSIPLRTGMPLMARPEALLPAAVPRVASLIIVGMLGWSCRTTTADRRDPRVLLELAVVLIAMLLLSERTWKHHMVTLFIVYLATWQMLTCYPWSSRVRFCLALGLILQFVLLHVSGSIVEYASVLTFGLVLCFVQNAIMLRAARTASAGAT